MQWLARGIFTVILLTLTPLTHAQNGGVRQAIEQLEHCSSRESKAGCVRILKQQPKKNGWRAVKAQIRGGRIIWYEFNPRTGAVRRTN